MPRANFESITIKKELYQKLELVAKEIAKQRHSTPKVATIAQELLWGEIEKRSDLKSYAPFLEQGNIEGQSVWIIDNLKRREVELVVRNGKLFCDLDNTDNCVHIGFAWSIPQVYRVMKEHGQRQPR